MELVTTLDSLCGVIYSLITPSSLKEINQDDNYIVVRFNVLLPPLLWVIRSISLEGAVTTDGGDVVVVFS